MGSVNKRDDGRWLARYRDADGKEHVKLFDKRKKKDADAWLDNVTASLVRGDYIDPALGRTMFETLADDYLGTVADLKPKTLAGYRSIIDKHLRPAFGRRQVATITTTDVRKLVASMRNDGSSYQTTRNTLNVLRSVLATAVESRMVAVNAAAGVSLPKGARRSVESQRRRDRVYLTADEVRRLADAMPEPYGLLVTFAAYTGLRAGELAGLRVSDLEMLKRRVTVSRSVAEVGGELIVGSTKSGESRSVTLPAFLVDELARYLAERGAGQGEPLFLSPTGGPMRHSNFYRRTFKPAVARAKLPSSLRFHDLRHTHAALLIAEGAHPKAIQERLGHSSIDVTMDIYGGLYESVEDALAEALDRVWREPSETFSRTSRGLGAL